MYSCIDCLSKWVGEGERQLRLLFEQARRYQPSIIFFDEIDGLAPVRSVKQDQIHGKSRKSQECSSFSTLMLSCFMEGALEIKKIWCILIILYIITSVAYNQPSY